MFVMVAVVLFHFLYSSPLYISSLHSSVSPALPPLPLLSVEWLPPCPRPIRGAGGWQCQLSLRTCFSLLCCWAGLPSWSCSRMRAFIHTCAQVSNCSRARLALRSHSEVYATHNSTLGGFHGRQSFTSHFLLLESRLSSLMCSINRGFNVRSGTLGSKFSLILPEAVFG